MPFVVISVTNINTEKVVTKKIMILFFAIIGITISPILTWIASICYEKTVKK